MLHEGNSTDASLETKLSNRQFPKTGNKIIHRSCFHCLMLKYTYMSRIPTEERRPSSTDRTNFVSSHKRSFLICPCSWRCTAEEEKHNPLNQIACLRLRCVLLLFSSLITLFASGAYDRRTRSRSPCCRCRWVLLADESLHLFRLRPGSWLEIASVVPEPKSAFHPDPHRTWICCFACCG